jgi:hypothetical protein
VIGWPFPPCNAGGAFGDTQMQRLTLFVIDCSRALLQADAARLRVLQLARHIRAQDLPSGGGDSGGSGSAFNDKKRFTRLP